MIFHKKEIAAEIRVLVVTELFVTECPVIFREPSATLQAFLLRNFRYPQLKVQSEENLPNNLR